MGHTLTITEGDKARGRIVFVPELGRPFDGAVAVMLDKDLADELEKIATVDDGSLWSPSGIFVAPLRLSQWQQLTAALMELRRRKRGLSFVWSSGPPSRAAQPVGTVF